VGFYQNKSCYEQFQKIDPKNPNSLPAISETERDSLLQANSNGRYWKGEATEVFPSDRRSYYKTTYNRSDGLAKATYEDDKKVFAVRSLVVEKQDEENEKKRQRENLQGF
jgi:hypothetical protein